MENASLEIFSLSYRVPWPPAEQYLLQYNKMLQINYNKLSLVYKCLNVDSECSTA